ncbi:MAG: ATP-binding protein [Thermoplasmata archaeon]
MDPVLAHLDSKKGRTKYRLTINEKILLHLLANLKFKDSREAPITITQKGIAEGVQIRWNHVPRAMAQLIKIDYVFERISHIEGKTRRQKTYYLTDGGMLAAKNLREKILDWEVYLKRSDDQIVKLKLSRVNSTLKTNFSPIKLYTNLSEEGIIDEKELSYSPVEKALEKVTKTFYAAGEISWPERLIGRDSEIKTLFDWIDGDEHRTIVIYGSIGIGKSVLMAEILHRYRDKKHIFWYQISERDTQMDILVRLSEFLTELGNTGLSEYLEAHDAIRLDEAMRLIEKGVKGMDVILAFDNYFKVGEDVADLFKMLTKFASNNESLIVLINAMDTTPFYCRFYDKSEVHKKKIAELTIKGLDKESCKLLLEAPNIDEDALKKIHLITRGHPLTLELIKRGDVNSLKRVKGFSRQEASLLLYLKGVEKT